MKEVIVKVEKGADGTLWGRCKFNNDLYIEAGMDTVQILRTIADLISEDNPKKKFKIRIAKYNIHQK